MRFLSSGARTWWALGVLCGGAFVVSMDAFTLLLALPSIARTLDATSTQQLWITDIYGFALVGLLLAAGGLADRLGRRRLLMIGAAGFALASALAAFSTSPEMLIAARALLGVAGATIAPSTLGIIGGMFPDPRRRSLAISLWLVAFVGGSGIGPIIGGLLLSHFAWGSVFLVPVPVLLLLLVAAPILLPKDRGTGHGRVDMLSVGLSAAAILPIVWGIKQLASGGQIVPVLLAIISGLIAALVFVRRQRSLTDPLLDLEVFRSRVVTTTVLSMIMVTMIGATLYFGAQDLQLVAGLSPLHAALVMVPSAVVSVLTFLLAPRLAQAIRPAYAIASGMAFSLAGSIVLATADLHAGPIVVLIGLALLDVGYGPILALGTDIVIGSAPPERASSAASISETGTEFGFAFGVALLGSVATAVYRGLIHLPAGLTSAQASRATESLAGALSVSVSTGEGPVLAAGRLAFMAAFHVVGWVSSGLALVVAVAAITQLRGIPRVARFDDAEAEPALQTAELPIPVR